MNKIQYAFLGLTVCILFFTVPIFAADWGSVTRLTETSTTSNCSYDRCIDDSKNAEGLWCHAIYEDCIDNNYEIFYSVYSAWLGSWSPMHRLTSDDDYASRFPSISCAGNYVHVVWHDASYGDNEICYRRCVYADQVWTWGNATRLSTDNTSASEYPAVKENNGYVHVAWTDSRDGSNVPQIYYKRAANNGSSWGSETRLTTHNACHGYPAVAASGNNVYVFWQDYYDGNYEIWYCC